MEVISCGDYSRKLYRIQDMRIDGGGAKKEDHGICISCLCCGLVNATISPIIWHEAISHIHDLVLT